MKLVLRKTDKMHRFAVFADRKDTGLIVCKGYERGEWSLWRGEDWLFTSTKDGCLKAIWCIQDALHDVTKARP